ncbi:MAG: DUF433 domain-containing protein [Xanthomonadales bacterium]|nr:DUF433 domain-containing protein [Xanthomonadales bacterium]MDZ4377274.1 DUF433 domain-containing protein [Xanthomonadaceae bacterium]
MSYHDHIALDPGERGGKPCIRGMQVTVHDVHDWMAHGMTEQQIIEDSPELVFEDIRQFLAFGGRQ